MTPRDFESLARSVLERRFGVRLLEQTYGTVSKRFDFVSGDGRIVGDAKYFTLVGRERSPPAKFSVIAEHVWLLQHTNAEHRFLAFGNQIEVPQMWLQRYGALVRGVVEFYFVHDDGNLTILL